MFENFTDDARGALERAQREAAGPEGRSVVTVGHLLSGLVAHSEGVGTALTSAGVDTEDVGPTTETGRTAPDRGTPTVHFSRDVRSALAKALRESRGRGQRELDAVHIALGLVVEDDVAPIEDLRSLGLDKEKFRRSLTDLLPSGP